MSSYRVAEGDRRYGCTLCSTLPGHGYLDRLSKGATLSKHQYSLQKHVETYHPEVTDWRSLKIDLGKTPRTQIRETKRKAAQISKNNGPEEDDDEDDDEDQNGDRDGDKVVDEGRTQSDSDSVRAKKVPRIASPSVPSTAKRSSRGKSSTNAPPTKGSRFPSATTARIPVAPSTAEPRVAARTLAQILFPEDEKPATAAPAPIPAPTPAPVPTPAQAPTSRSLAQVLFPEEEEQEEEMPVYAPPTTRSRERTNNSQTSNSDYRATNENLRQQVSGLLRAISNAVAEEIHGFPFSVQGVRNALLHFSGGDGQLVEQVLDRVVADVSTRQPSPQGGLPYAPVLAQHTGPVRSVPQSAPRVVNYRDASPSDSSDLSDAPTDEPTDQDYHPSSER